MECIPFVRGHLYELSGLLSYTGAELTDQYYIPHSGGSRISRRGGAWTSYGGLWTPEAATF